MGSGSEILVLSPQFKKLTPFVKISLLEQAVKVQNIEFLQELLALSLETSPSFALTIAIRNHCCKSVDFLLNRYDYTLLDLENALKQAQVQGDLETMRKIESVLLIS